MWAVARAWPYIGEDLELLGEEIRIEVGMEERHTKICFVRAIDVSLKYAVGPSGRCTIVIASRVPDTLLEYYHY